jgi:hypothetical protein
MAFLGGRQSDMECSKSVQKRHCEFYWFPAGSIRLAAQSISLFTIAFLDGNLSSEKKRKGTEERIVKFGNRDPFHRAPAQKRRVEDHYHHHTSGRSRF